MTTQIGAVKQFTGPGVVARAAGQDGRSSIVISTVSRDRDNDRILIGQLAVPDRLPVLFSHDYRDLPIGMTTDIVRSPTTLRANFTWLEGDERAAKVKNAFMQNMLAASIGMRVTEATPNSFGGSDLAGELLEWSLVGVPANPECTRLLKSLGFSASSLPHGSETVLILRDGPTNNPRVPGKPTCPGPADGDGCEWRPNLPIEQCPATRCPIRGENLQASFSGIVLHDDAPAVGSDVQLAALVATTVRGVIEEAVTKSTREWITRLTGKID